MADPFTGEIRAFGFNYPPYDWAFCAGQQVAIQQNPALYSILANRYGGDLKTYFNLPNLRGLVPQGAGTPGPGWPNLPSTAVAQTQGADTVTLSTNNMPTHTHALSGAVSSGYATATDTPNASAYLSRTSGAGISTQTTTGVNYRAWNNLQTPDVSMAAQMVAPTGGSGNTVLPHENRQPFLVMNFCICLSGEYPVKPD